MVKEHQLSSVPVNQIDFDDSNPNEMSTEQMEALEAAMTKYGYLDPVILQKTTSGRYSVIDGEHRVKTYLSMHKADIPCYVLDVNETDKKILRQTMNKLRGTHDPVKDLAEFNFIEQQNQLDTLAELIATPKELLLTEMDDHEVEVDPSVLPDKMNAYLFGNIKQLHLLFSNDEYEDIIPRLEKIIEAKGLKTHTEVFMELLGHYENHPPQ